MGQKKQTQPSTTESTYTTTIGGEKYKGSDDYLRSIMDVYRRIGTLSAGNERRKSLLWDLEYCTEYLINGIIDPIDRDAMAKAFRDITQIEYLKRCVDPTKYRGIDELKHSLTDDELVESGIRACFIVIGETRTYYDRYFGFEQKLEVMRRHDIGNTNLVDESEHIE